MREMMTTSIIIKGRESILVSILNSYTQKLIGNQEGCRMSCIETEVRSIDLTGPDTT
jgi:hypothetical protein